MKTRVLYLITDSNIGGTERTLLSLLRGMSRDNINPYVCVLKSPGDLFTEYEKLSTHAFSLRMRSAFHIMNVRGLVNFICDSKIDIVHSFLFHSNIVARIMKILIRDIIVINSHRTIERGKQWHLIMDRFCKYCIDYETANAQAVKEYYIKETNSNRNRFSVIYNGILEPQKCVTKMVKNRFLCVGSFSEAKGQMVLIRALKKVRDEGVPFHMTFVGDGPVRRACELRIINEGLSDYVEFVGNVSSPFQRYLAPSCVIIPSLWEGLPNVLLEAMAAGKYVIATDVGGVREVCNGIDTVTIIPPNDVIQLAQAVSRHCQDNRIDSVSLQNNSRSIVNEYSFSRMTESYEKLYVQLMHESESKNVKK